MKTPSTPTTNSLTICEAIGLFKDAARKEAVSIASTEYEKTHKTDLQTAFHSGNQDAHEAVFVRLPRDLFDGYSEEQILTFLDIPADSENDEDLECGLSEDKIIDAGKEWANLEMIDGEGIAFVRGLGTEDLILGSWLGINVSRADLEHAAQTLFNETYGDIQNAESGRTYTLWLDNDLTPEVRIDQQSGEYVEVDGTVSSKPILSFDFETECDMDDEDDLTAWQEHYDEGQAGQIASWVLEMTASLDEAVAAESE